MNALSIDIRLVDLLELSSFMRAFIFFPITNFKNINVLSQSLEP